MRIQKIVPMTSDTAETEDACDRPRLALTTAWESLRLEMLSHARLAMEVWFCVGRIIPSVSLRCIIKPDLCAIAIPRSTVSRVWRRRSRPPANTSIVLLKGWLIFWEKVLTADEKAKAAPAAKSKEKVKEKAQAAKEKKKAAKDSTYVIQCVVFLAGDLLLFSNARVHLKQISFKYE